MKKVLKKYWVLGLVILLAVIRFGITFHLTAYEIASHVVDDTLIVLTAFELKSGFWQGAFSSFTMVKGITAPLILSVISKFHMSYILFSSIAYILASVCIILSLKNLIKNKFALFIIYIIVLFNPVMFGQEVVQRVYRNAFVPTLSLIVISLYFYILSNSNLKTVSLILINILTGIFLGLFYNLREENFWIFPFIVFVSIFLFANLTKVNNMKRLHAIIICLIPIFILIMINNIICFINYQYYDIYRRVDSVNTPYTRTYSYISKIDYPSTDIRESVSREKLEFLFTISPSLEKYHERLIRIFNDYDMIDEHPGNGKLDNGWWNWTFRASVATTEAYQNARVADEYYSSVYEELKEAERQGKIQIRKESYLDIIKQYVKILASSMKYVVCFQEIESDISVESIYDPNFNMIDQRYREITNDKFIYSKEDIEKYHIVDGEEQNRYLEKYEYVSNYLNYVIKIYRYVNVVAFVFSIIGYLMSVVDLISKNERKLMEWVMMSSLLGTMFTILCGYSYVTLMAFNAIRYEYLSGSYGVMLLFECLAIYYLVEKIKNRKIGETNERV